MKLITVIHYEVHTTLMTSSRSCIQRSRSQKTFSKMHFCSGGVLINSLLSKTI